MHRPKSTEYAEFYAGYIKKVPKGSIAALHRKSFKDCLQAYGSISEAHGNSSYAPGKWTVKELIIHNIDSERVFAYRAMAFMRGERIALPGFVQDQYVENAFVADRTIKDLLAEWKAVHANTLFLIKQCTSDQEAFMGKASGWPITPRALFYIMVGHRYHHLQVLNEKYLPALK